MTARISQTPEDFTTLAILKGSTTVIFKDEEGKRVFTKQNKGGLTYTEITGLYREAVSHFSSEHPKESKSRSCALQATALVSEDVKVIGTFMLIPGSDSKSGGFKSVLA